MRSDGGFRLSNGRLDALEHAASAPEGGHRARPVDQWTDAPPDFT
jgi:hypothetical protein